VEIEAPARARHCGQVVCALGHLACVPAGTYSHRPVREKERSPIPGVSDPEAPLGSEQRSA